MDRGLLARVEASLRADATLVPTMRDLARGLSERLLDGDEDAPARVAMVTHELLENAVKYALEDAAYLCIEVRAEGEAAVVTITTRNRAAPEHARAVVRACEAMAAEADALAYYVALMRRNAPLEGSGLGLARIWAEGDMTVACEVAGHDLVLSARAAVALSAPGGRGGVETPAAPD
ncbi:MAG TPA: hypothetical protein VFS43_30435 [Polyangiaceae bacterium]|nr:hypothetical protein [Polyangiaceae bacterium]